jgi:hypothetical protein
VTDQYTPLRDALVDVTETVTTFKRVLTYEPSMIEVHPMAWVILDSYRRSAAPAGLIGRTLRFMVRCVTTIQDSKAAEDELIAAALLVADGVEANKQFSGVVVEGLATSPDGRVGWISAGGVRTRVVDVFCEAYIKYAY